MTSWLKYECHQKTQLFLKKDLAKNIHTPWTFSPSVVTCSQRKKKITFPCHDAAIAMFHGEHGVFRISCKLKFPLYREFAQQKKYFTLNPSELSSTTQLCPPPGLWQLQNRLLVAFFQQRLPSSLYKGQIHEKQTTVLCSSCYMQWSINTCDQSQFADTHSCTASSTFHRWCVPSG